MRLRKLPLRLAYSVIVFDGLRRRVVFHPCEQSLGTVKSEDVAAARHGIETIGEAGFGAGGLVAERQRRAPGGNPEGHAFHVLLGLLLDAGQRMAGGFGLNRADRFAIDKERVIRLAAFEGKLAHGDAARGREIHRPFVLHHPTARVE